MIFSGMSITVKLAITIKLTSPIMTPENSVLDQQNKANDSNRRIIAKAFEAL